MFTSGDLWLPGWRDKWSLCFLQFLYQKNGRKDSPPSTCHFPFSDKLERSRSLFVGIPTPNSQRTSPVYRFLLRLFRRISVLRITRSTWGPNRFWFICANSTTTKTNDTLDSKKSDYFTVYQLYHKNTSSEDTLLNQERYPCRFDTSLRFSISVL